jgi:ABC-type transport system involved in multi-copper enzyme maturation permease subunit
MGTQKMQMTQALGVARYEFRMLWRERALIVITLALLLMVLVSSWVATNEIVGQNASAFEVMADTRLSVTQVIIFVTWAPLGGSLALLVPVFMADMIPKDRQLRVHELLNTLPVSPTAYLVGKLLGAWLAIGSSLLIVMLVTLGFWWLRIGVFDLGPYLEMWLVGAIPLAIMNGGLGVLLPAALPTRGHATLLMTLMFVGMFLLISNIEQDVTSPVRGPIILYFLDLDEAQITVDLFRQSIGMGFAQLAVVWTVIWGYLRWRQAAQ